MKAEYRYHFNARVPMNRFHFVLVMLSMVALLVGTTRAAQAAESYDNCTGFITSIPAVISAPGTWCLNQDLNAAITSGNAIRIDTDDATLDCNGFKLVGLTAGLGTQAVGVHALGRRNVTVRHCDIRGFYLGLYLKGSSGGRHMIEDNRCDSNTQVGLWVEGDGSVVQRNRVFNTGKSTSAASAYGITTTYAVDIQDNLVSGVAARTGGRGLAFGIYTSLNPKGSINGNRVRGLLKDDTGSALGIYNSNSNRVVLRNNDLVGDSSAGSVGLRCTNANGLTKGNVVSGFATAILLCGGAGSNYMLP